MCYLKKKREREREKKKEERGTGTRGALAASLKQILVIRPL
jgi:hypothetical protein